MGYPVASRTTSASTRRALPPPAAAPSLRSSSWLLPATRAMTTSPSTAKTRLLTIWPTSTPMAAAASAAVLVPSGKRRTSMARPRASAASVTRRTFGCIVSLIVTRSWPLGPLGPFAHSQDRVDGFGQPSIAVRDGVAGVVRGQLDGHRVPHVRPVGVVVHLLG